MIKRAQFEKSSSPESSSPRSSSPGSSASQSRVRGRPFQPGNPGRPPGSKNKLTPLLEELVENEGQELTRKLIDLAKERKLQALLFCMKRLIPQRRGQPINLQLPEMNSVNDVAPTMAALLEAIGNGTITPEEASPIIGLLNSYANASIAADVVVRLEKIEATLKIQGKT
jgi:hypothetical protein